MDCELEIKQKKETRRSAAQLFWHEANLHGSFAVKSFDLLRFYHTRINVDDIQQLSAQSSQSSITLIVLLWCEMFI